MADTITEAIDEAQLLMSARTVRLTKISDKATGVTTRGFTTRKPTGE